MKVRLLYFASLADRAGCAEESVETNAFEPSALFEEVSLRHSFSLGKERVRVAVNGAIVNWNQPLNDGDEIVFLPPVSGG